ncbi:MAG: hypothetical protein GHCLOJNM_00991 [bacterium]|nr:hypothetical protein [bacterium]
MALLPEPAHNSPAGSPEHRVIDFFRGGTKGRLPTSPLSVILPSEWWLVVCVCGDLRETPPKMSGWFKRASLWFLVFALVAGYPSHACRCHAARTAAVDETHGALAPEAPTCSGCCGSNGESVSGCCSSPTPPCRGKSTCGCHVGCRCAAGFCTCARNATSPSSQPRPRQAPERTVSPSQWSAVPPSGTHLLSIFLAPYEMPPSAVGISRALDSIPLYLAKRVIRC